MPDHPQLFDALPKPVEDALRASIERFGVLVPVVQDQHGNLIDGRHRLRIAKELKIEPRFDTVQVAGEEQAREIQRTLNADRRHLTEDQRRAMVADLRREGHSERAIAGALGVSQTTVHRDIERASTDSGESVHPERVRSLDGKSRPARRPTVVPGKSAREAQRAQQALQVLGDAAPERPLDVKRAERLAREHVAEQRRAEPIEPVTIDDTADIEIRHGDFREILADLGDVDAVITDPPYPREFVPLFADLGELAARILKPSGTFAAMTGQSHLRDYLALLDQHLAYRWMGAYLVQGPRNRVHQARVGTGWKPILLYTCNDATDVPFLLDDLFDSSGDDKNHHYWGQSESGIADLVERLTKPGDLVVDPFLGGGTTAVVCKALGRRFIGCDLDPAAVATSRERVA